MFQELPQFEGFETLESLGKVSAGYKYKVRDLSDNAIRFLLTTTLSKSEDIELSQQQATTVFQNEVKILSKCNHLNILKFIDLRKDKTKRQLYIILEYIESITLKNYLLLCDGESIDEKTIA